MLQRLTKPQNSTQRKPFNYIKSLFAGYVAANVYSNGHLFFENQFTATNALDNVKQYIKKNRFTLNGAASQMMSGSVRFAFYDIFKRFFDAGFGEWSEKMRYFTYGVSAVAAEVLAVTVSLPFNNVKILEERATSLEQIERLRNATNQAQIREIFPDEAVKPNRPYYHGYRQALLRSVPITAITFTAFELASEIWYDYIVRTPKEKYNGLNQSLFSFINGSIAGAAFYGVSRALKNFDVPVINASPKVSLIFYTLSTGIQFTVFNLLKTIFNGQTLGSGTNSRRQ